MGGGGGSGLTTRATSPLGGDPTLSGEEVFKRDCTGLFSSPAKSSFGSVIGLGLGRLKSILETVLRGTGGGPPLEGTSISAFFEFTSGKL